MECFGDSSDDESDGASADNALAITRDESCGVCAFHPNTETALITHVRNTLQATRASASRPANAPAALPRSRDVLDAVDAFCRSRHWMMHVGPDKGDILVRALRDALRDGRARAARASHAFVAVELGTYCGYAALLMARTFAEARAEIPALPECHLHTTEIHGAYADVATEMIRLSGMEDMISVHRISYDGHDTDVDAVLRQALQRKDTAQRSDRNETPVIDFLFIDHDKDSYTPDLRKLEAAGMVRRGTRVVADNVLFAGIHDYVEYVQQRATEGVVETKTIPCCVEYSADSSSTQPQGERSLYQDGVEITDYLRDI